jgi:hypothetical protein
MINYSISKVYVLLNKVLNTLVRKKFGKQYSIRLNSLCFIANRTNVYYSHTCSEKITLKSLRPIDMNELILIKEFLLFNINTTLLCIHSECFVVVDDLELKIVSNSNY